MHVVSAIVDVAFAFAFAYNENCVMAAMTRTMSMMVVRKTMKMITLKIIMIVMAANHASHSYRKATQLKTPADN